MKGKLFIEISKKYSVVFCFFLNKNFIEFEGEIRHTKSKFLLSESSFSRAACTAAPKDAAF